ITATNLGPNNASNVVINEFLPPGLLPTGFANFYANSSYDATNRNWYITNLPPAVSALLTITVQVQSSGSMANTAFISSSGTIDTNSANNSASVTVNGQYPQADV